MDVAPTTPTTHRADSLEATPAEYQRAGLLGRFTSGVEPAYREWEARRALPVIRVIGWISVLIWAIGPLAVQELLSQDAPIGVWIICWGVHIPILAAGLLVVGRYPRFWLAASGLVLVGIDSLVLIQWMDVAQTAPVMVTLTIFDLYLAPVMQFPFRTTALCLAVLLPTTLVWALSTAEHEGSADGGLNFQLWLMCSAAVLALGMTLVAENNSRRRFVDERMLDRQRALLTSSRALLRRYAPPAVADRIEHGDITVDGAQRRRVTVFFADIVGFTTLADRLDPEALAEIVNEYLGSVAQIIDNHGGTLNEFAGDGVMALFGAPEEMEPRAQVMGALAAARELQRSLPEWSRQWYTLGIDQDLAARIGINTGVVSVGTFGSAVRATYTGIGLQTNIAARIQAECPPGSMLLSRTSWHLVADTISCEPRGEVEVKGVHFPIAMYEPTDLEPVRSSRPILTE